MLLFPTVGSRRISGKCFFATQLHDEFAPLSIDDNAAHSFSFGNMLFCFGQFHQVKWMNLIVTVSIDYEAINQITKKPFKIAGNYFTRFIIISTTILMFNGCPLF